MDKETVSYIINYFSVLLKDKEKLALKYLMNPSKSEDNAVILKIMKTSGWISDNEDVRDLLKDGYEPFELKIAKKIINQFPEKVFLNNCPKCNKLARTPDAKQCRHCGHQWRKPEEQNL